ncbi:MAG: glutamate--tRNA ligase [Rikenellaceae bacterium]
MERKVRVRFAPSPTGALHMGGVRTALYNYLFARHHGGEMILRIEDTDSQRFVEGAEDYIIESLKWCGVTIDEGVGVGGPHAPYRQSERREIYWQYAQSLVESGWAYYAFDTAEELDAKRKEAEAAGAAFAYNYSVRCELPTSLSLSAEEVEARIARGEQWVIRFKMPENEIVAMDDLIRGHVEVNTSTLDDKVLYKSVDRLPTYHLANIVDDRLMEISHVIRGEEWLPSLPLHYLLYQALGWEELRPAFAHLPLLLKPTGGGKLSKRDGDKLGFPVFPLEWKPQGGESSRGYREDGYFAEAFINMLALLGWNPGTEQELFSMEQLIEEFSLERVSKSGARFQPDKAKWFNAQYMHAKSAEELAPLFQPILKSHGVEVSDELAGRAAYIMRERATFVADLWDLTSYFFVAPTEYDAKQSKKYWKGDNPRILSELREVLAAIEDFSLSNTEAIVGAWIAERGYGMGQVMNTLRLALVGAGKGPGMYDVTEFIGREECLRRIDHILEQLPVPAAV